MPIWGPLFITRVAGEDAATEKPLIDKFWQSLRLNVDAEASR